jgi:cytochrome c oxidase subunit 2
MNTKYLTAGIAIAVVALALGAIATARLAADEPDAHVIKITAKRYEFTPDSITLKKGEPVTLEFTSEDRTHGFLVKPLGIDMDITPGKPNDVTVRPDVAGTYTAICDHYCGLGHGGMKMTIVVQ